MQIRRYHKKRTQKQLFSIIIVVISILMVLLYASVASAVPAQHVVSPETAVVTDNTPLKINSREDAPDLSTQKDNLLSPLDMWLGTAVTLMFFGVIGYVILNYSID